MFQAAARGIKGYSDQIEAAGTVPEFVAAQVHPGGFYQPFLFFFVQGLARESSILIRACLHFHKDNVFSGGADNVQLTPSASPVP